MAPEPSATACLAAHCPKASPPRGTWRSGSPAPRWAGPVVAPPPAGVGCLQARSRLSVSASPPPPPGTVELGPPFAREFCGRIGSAVTSQRAGPAAAMVAKDYPFYLTVKRANCSLEVPPASSPAKDAEVGTSAGLLGPAGFSPVPLFPPLTLDVPLVLPASPSPALTLSPFRTSLWVKPEPPSPCPCPSGPAGEQQPLAPAPSHRHPVSASPRLSGRRSSV